MDFIRKRLREYTSKFFVCIVLALLAAPSLAQTLPITAVGRTPGEAGVSATGQATYQIPIWVPPGVRGIQPQLALSYVSQGGDGLIGPGWSISGLSQISRCQKTIEHDGFREAVLLTYADAFCMGGRRLRLTSGAGTYGQANSTYQTEVADFSVVTANGTTGNGPTWFEVKLANGLIYEYGNSTASRAVLTGTTTPYLWALSKVRDRQGNSMRITYAQGSGTLAPSSIEYTQTSASGTTYPYAVSFTYGTRDLNDRTMGYIAGAQYTVGSQLLRIDVTRNGSLTRRYHLSYADSPTTQRSRLTTVQECSGASGTDCLAPTQFSYQDGTAGLATPVTQYLNHYTGFKFADLNGDGREDLFSLWLDGVSATWRYYLATASGAFSPSVLLSFGSGDDESVLFDDFFGDGKLAILSGASLYDGDGYWHLHRWNGSGVSDVTTGVAVEANRIHMGGRTFTSADVNGDGKADLIWAAVNSGVASVYTRLNTSVNGVLSFSPTATVAYPLTSTNAYSVGRGSGSPRIDFNGDGREDVLLITTSTPNGPRTPTTLISQGTTFATGPTLPSTSDWREPSPVFFNNDACTDLATTTSVHISPCNGSAGQTLALTVDRRVMLDWNGDGRDDVLGVIGSTWYAQLSEGNAVSAPIGPINVPSTAILFHAADTNGDGLKDLVVGDDEVNQIWYAIHNGTDVLPDLVTGIVDGYGNSFQPTYKSITRGNYTSTYSGMPTIGTADAELAKPFYVVDQFTSSDGSGGTYQTQFHYYSARVNTQGRGFKGFAQRRTRDGRTGLYSYEEYRQDFPYIGAIASQYLYQSNGATLIQSKVNSFGSTTLDASATNGRRFPYVSQTVDKVYEVGGTFNGAHILTRTSANQFDSYGTLVDQTITTTEVGTGLNAGAVHTERLQQLSVQNDATNWCLNKPSTVMHTRSHTLPGGVAVTRTTDLNWDLANCRLDEQVVEPSSSQWRVDTALDYDAFGNVDSIVVTPVTGQGQAARTTTMYWGTDGQFPVSITNPKGQVASIGWDALRGVRSMATDINNQTTAWSYDNFGRLVLETRPDLTKSAFAVSWCNSSNSYCGASALRYKVEKTERDTSNAAIRVDAIYHDGFDRVRREEQQILGGAISSTIANYDARGRLSAQSAPFLAGDPIWYTSYSYDSLDRIGQIERQASETDTSLATTQITYEGLRTTVTDPLGHATSVIRNAVGQVVQALDAGGNDTDYEYDAFNNLVRTRDFYGNESSFGYNVRGMKMSSNDIDTGAWSYNYFPLGELKSQTTAKNQTSTFTYDALSRPLTRIEPEGTTTWTWDTAANGVGQLASVSSPGAYSETYSYDTLGRVSQVGYVADGMTYTFNSTYNANTGLLETLTYPTSTAGTRVKLRYSYQNGLMQSVRDYTGNVLGTVYWQANSTDAASQIIDEQLGNGLRTISSYDRITGALESRTTGPGGGSTRQNSEYYWDKVGNLTQRREVNLGLTESFYYDSLDRLDYSQLNGVTNLDVAYDAIGNITSKTGVGSYTYHATKKHAVTSAGSNTYTYDTNGNMITRNGASVAWASYDLPTAINQSDGQYSQFSYGADRSRYKQVSLSSTFGIETTIYVGELFERVTRSASTEYKHYVSTPSGSVAVINRKSTGTNEVYYLLRDHLGSTEMITNASGGQMARVSADAFGKRRNGGTWSGTPAASAQTTIYGTTHRGFTGHEHLDNLDLIHMNGRVYDPVLGRFMSADPFVKSPYFSQSLNRYSYTLNNPLRYTDPSGYMEGGRGRTRVDAGWGLEWFPAGDWVWTSGSDAPWSIDQSEYASGAIGSYVIVTPSTPSGVIPPSTVPPPPSSTPVTPPSSAPPVTAPGSGTPAVTPPSVPVPGPPAGVPGLGSTVGGTSWWRSALDWLGTPLTDPFPRYVHLPYGGVLYSPDGREITWDEPLTRGELIGGAAGTLGAFGTLPRAASVLTRGATAASSTAFRILEQEGNVIIGSFNGAAGEARVITELVRQGDTLILRGTHIEGAGTLREALNVARQFGRDQGVKRVIIEGGRRSTGANPGHTPRPITVETGL